MRVIFLLIAAWSMGHAEQRVVVTGSVLDPSGAAVPSAVVQLRDHGTGERISAITSDRGRYFIRLRPGLYDLAVDALGFERYSRGTLAVEAGRTAVVDVSLEIAPLAQRMTVAAKAPPLEGELETRTRNFQEVLEIREVRESSARDVAEAVSRIEGLWKIRKGGIANDVVLRGFQQDNINVLIDGHRIYGACPSNMDPPAFHVDFAEVKHVEIVKGAFDIANQGSLGGAVNIVSKEPTRGLRLTPNFSAGSFGYLNPSVTAISPRSSTG